MNICCRTLVGAPRAWRMLALGALVALAGCNAPWGGARGGAGREPREDALVAEAQQLAAGGREDEALAILSRAIERNPTLTVAHMALADIYSGRGEYTEAERAYATAAQIEPANFDAQYKHGLTLHLLNRVAEAIRAYLRALAIRPDDFEANLNLATAYLQLDGPQQALAYAQRASQLNPSSGAAHANLGAVYSALNRHADAVREYEAAAELMELSPALLLNLAESLGKTGRYAQMVNTLDALLRLEPSAAAYERLGYALFKQRQYERAAENFRKAVAVDQSHYPALNGLGVCLLNQYLASGRSDEAARSEAMQYFRRSLRINDRQARIVELVSRYGP